MMVVCVGCVLIGVERVVDVVSDGACHGGHCGCVVLYCGVCVVWVVVEGVLL